jgi:hypothetical protein
MVKFIMFCSKAIIATAAGLVLTSCNWTVDLGNSITGSGNIVKETRKLDSFTKVEVKTGIDCEILQANNFEVVVEADDNVIKEIKTRVENGTLILESDFGNYRNATRKVTVTMPKIDNLESTSGATLKSLNTLTATKVYLKSSSGSEMNVTVESDTISLETSSGSEQNIKGKALKLYATSSSGSSINANELLANDVSAQSTSGSSIEVHSILNIDGKASSGSSINYKGNPKIVNKEESSGGSVSR